MRVGIIGLGTVGGAMHRVLSLFHERVKGYDVNPQVSLNTLDETLDSDIVLIAVPTPLRADTGRLDASIVDDCLKMLDDRLYEGDVVIKSTLPLGFMWQARRDYTLRLTYSPEFLRERYAFKDFLAPRQVIYSGRGVPLRDLLWWVSPDKFNEVDDATAEMIKLAMNAFFATKVSFINEVERICRIYGVDAAQVSQALIRDGRAAPFHLDPTRGPYGGKCLPKDVHELARSASRTWLLDAVERVNARAIREWSTDE